MSEPTTSSCASGRCLLAEGEALVITTMRITSGFEL
jgi:hypothetical protein